jgi:hypothetical protein
MRAITGPDPPRSTSMAFFLSSNGEHPSSIMARDCAGPRNSRSAPGKRVVTSSLRGNFRQALSHPALAGTVYDLAGEGSVLERIECHRAKRSDVRPDRIRQD